MAEQASSNAETEALTEGHSEYLGRGRGFMEKVSGLFDKVKNGFNGFFEEDVKHVQPDYTCREDWMSRLPGRVRRLPLKNLAIPGSHNSFALKHEMETKNAFCPGEYSDTLIRFMKLAKGLVKDMSVTQDLTATQQLQLGIRYFDIRTVYGKPTSISKVDFFATHGLYAGLMRPKFQEIREFAANHPKELIILYFQRFHGFNVEIHRDYVRMIKDILGDQIIPSSNFDPNRSSLDDLLLTGKQILVVYEGPFCHSAVLHNPWSQLGKPDELVAFLDKSLNSRDDYRLHVLQGIMQFTPKALLTCFKFKCSTIEIFAKRSNNLLISWLEDKTNLNIVLTDFCQYADIVGKIVAKNHE